MGIYQTGSDQLVLRPGWSYAPFCCKGSRVLIEFAEHTVLDENRTVLLVHSGTVQDPDRVQQQGVLHGL